MSEYSYSKEELTLKDILELLHQNIHELRSKWYIIFVAILISSTYQIYAFYKVKTTYPAKLRFVVEGQQGAGGGISSLLGSFGFNKSNNLSPYKVLEVGKSNNILKKILSTKRKDIMIGNMILDNYDLLKNSENEKLKRYRFKKSLCKENLTLNESITLKKIKKLLWGVDGDRSEAIIDFNFNEETGIYAISVNSYQEELSFELCNNLYFNLKLFFEEEVFKKKKQFSEILNTKVDSLEKLRNMKVVELARFRDRNRNLILSDIMAREVILTQEQYQLSAALVEIMKNKEMTDVNLRDQQPLFMSIDSPYFPLNASHPSLIKMLILGFIIGFFISSSIILFRRGYLKVIHG